MEKLKYVPCTYVHFKIKLSVIVKVWLKAYQTSPFKYLGQRDKSCSRIYVYYVPFCFLSQLCGSIPSTPLGQQACKFYLPNQGQQEARSTGSQSRVPVYVCIFSTVKFKFKIGLFMSEDIDFYS